jgi:hypothetical protein
MTPRDKPKLADKILLWMSTHRMMDGLWLGSVGNESNLHRIKQSLELIKAYDPLRYDRLRVDLERVWVRLLPGDVACFDARLRACVLDTRFVLRHTPELIAAAIVHEATHARLSRAGVAYDEALRDRIEAICTRRELAFAAKLPDGREVREWAEAALAHAVDLTDAEFDQHHLRGSIEALHYRGVPEWLTRSLVAMRNLLFAKRRAAKHRNGCDT